MIVKIERKERKKRAKEKLEKMGRRVSQATDAIKKMRKKADKYKDKEPDTDNDGDIDLEAGANLVESNGRIDTNKYFWWFIVLAIFCGFFIGWIAHTGLITSLEADPIQ